MAIVNRDITGKRFSRLTAVSFHHYGKHGYNYWLFKCDCGKTIVCTGSEVWRSRRKSCGCLRRETLAKANLKHGCRLKRIYRIWQGMRQRCENKEHTAFSRYGGRGIKVCKRWCKFENFLKDMGEPPEGYTLDRKNNSLGYCPSNCRWSTRKEQNRNARTNTCFLLNGVTKCLSAWAEEFKVPYLRVWGRVNKLGWELRRALTEPVHLEKVRIK